MKNVLSFESIDQAPISREKLMFLPKHNLKSWKSYLQNFLKIVFIKSNFEFWTELYIIYLADTRIFIVTSDPINI